MKAYLFGILTTVILIFSACTEEKKDSKHYLSINFISEDNNKYCYLYGFIGDKQILIDSVIIQNNVLQYSFAENCKPGIYRILLPGNQLLDFIFNNENIEIELDTKKVISSISIEESNENKILYTFLKEFFLFNERVNQEQKLIKSIPPSKRADKIKQVNKILTEKYISLFTRNLQIKATESMAYSIIKSMYTLDYQKYKALYPLDSISKTDYYCNKYFSKFSISDTRLNDSPFYYVMTKQYLKKIESFNETELQKAFTSLFGISKDESIIKCIKDFSMQYFWQTHNVKAINILTQSYTDACAVNSKIDSTKTRYVFKGLFSRIQSLPEISFDFSKQSFLLFTDNTCSKTTHLDSSIYSSSKKLISKSIIPFVISAQKSKNFTQLCDTFSILCLPTIICINNSGKVSQRLYGTKECKNYIQSIIANN